MTDIATIFGGRIRVRACGVLVHRQRVLLVNHRFLNEENIFWNVPGGGLEEGEDVVSGLRREFREEAHLEVAVHELLHTHEHIAGELHAVELYFRVTAQNIAPRLGADPEGDILSELRWFTAKELSALKPGHCPPFLQEIAFGTGVEGGEDDIDGAGAEGGASVEGGTGVACLRDSSGVARLRDSTGVARNAPANNRFSADNSHQYTLVLELQFSHFRFLVQWGEHLLWLEDHFLGSTNDLATCLARCGQLLEQHPVLGIRNWAEVRLTTDFEIFTLVPTADFQPDMMESYLRFTYPTAQADDFVVQSRLAGGQQVVSGTPGEVYRYFAGQFPGLRLISAVALAAEHLDKMASDTALAVFSDAFVTLGYRRGKMQQTVVEKLALRHLHNIPQLASRLVVLGEITPFSPLYKVAGTVFQTVEAGETGTPEGQSDEIPWHRYFTLLRTAADVG